MTILRRISMIRQSFLVALLIIALSVSIAAQAPEGAEENAGHSLYKGSKALQFGITSSLKLTSFQGVTFSGKKHISDKIAFRIGLSMDFALSDRDINNISIAFDTTTSWEKRTYNRDDIDLRIQYMRYTGINRNIKFYWAGGPVIGFLRLFEKRKDNEPSIFQSSDEILIWELGGSLAFGIEYFATSDISIHSEYYLDLIYSWRRDKSNRYYETSRSSTRDRTQGLSLSSSNIRFGLSAYF